MIAVGKKARRTVLISPKNVAPDHTDNGTLLLNAISKLNDASEENPYLVIIEPAIYNIGSTALQMKPYVDIQGSGQNVTKITGAIDDTASGVVNGAHNAEIRFLTVENTANGFCSNGIYNSHSSLTITDVTAKASNGTNINRGIYCNDSTVTMTNVTATGSGREHSFGILFNTSTPSMINVTAIAASGAVDNFGISFWESSPNMNNVTVTASGGTLAYGIFNQNASSTISNSNVTAFGGTESYGVYNETTSNVKIDHSRIGGSTASVYASEDSTTRIGNTRLEGGPIITNEGDCVCAGVYDEDYTFYPTTCP